jgi:hypothetical protein
MAPELLAVRDVRLISNHVVDKFVRWRTSALSSPRSSGTATFLSQPATRGWRISEGIRGIHLGVRGAPREPVTGLLFSYARMGTQGSRSYEEGRGWSLVTNSLSSDQHDAPARRNTRGRSNSQHWQSDSWFLFKALWVQTHSYLSDQHRS